MQKTIKKVLIFLLKVYAVQTPVMISFMIGTTFGSEEWLTLKEILTLPFWQVTMFNQAAKFGVGMIITYGISLVFAIWALIPSTFMKVIRTRIDLKQLRLIQADAQAKADQAKDDLQKSFVAFVRHMKSIHIAQDTWRVRSQNVIQDTTWIRKNLYDTFTQEFGEDIKEVFGETNCTKLYKKHFKNDIYKIYNKVH